MTEKTLFLIFVMVSFFIQSLIVADLTYSLIHYHQQTLIGSTFYSIEEYIQSLKFLGGFIRVFLFCIFLIPLVTFIVVVWFGILISTLTYLLLEFHVCLLPNISHLLYLDEFVLYFRYRHPITLMFGFIVSNFLLHLYFYFGHNKNEESNKEKGE